MEKRLSRAIMWSLLTPTMGGWRRTLVHEIERMIDEFDDEPDWIDITIWKRGPGE